MALQLDGAVPELARHVAAQRDGGVALQDSVAGVWRLAVSVPGRRRLVAGLTRVICRVSSTGVYQGWPTGAWVALSSAEAGGPNRRLPPQVERAAGTPVRPVNHPPTVRATASASSPSPR